MIDAPPRPTTAVAASAVPAVPRVSVAEPLVAGLATFLAIAGLARYGAGVAGALAAGLAGTMVVLTAVDLRERRLPNMIVVPAAVIALALRMATEPSAEWIAAAGLAALFFFLPRMLQPGSIGMGDVKLAALIGAAFGAATMSVLLIGLLSLVPVIAVLFARHGSAARKMALPLGPFLAFGTLVVLFAGGLA